MKLMKTPPTITTPASSVKNISQLMGWSPFMESSGL
jgi:hypothetical protein